MDHGRYRMGVLAERVTPTSSGGNNQAGSEQQPTKKENIHVFCRLKPIDRLRRVGVKSCLRAVSDTIVQANPPQRVPSQTIKELRYKFKRVFDERCCQEEVFNVVAVPLVKSLLNGRNSLLFTYGTTGSGKTYTMTGTEPNLTGIVPRALELIIDSVGHAMAPTNLMTPDGTNGYRFQKDFLQLLSNHKAEHNYRLQADAELGACSINYEQTKVKVNENCLYAVFVTYIEIHNNLVYDLLEDGTDDFLRARHQITKTVREDSLGNMYVQEATEVEVKSPHDAIKAFRKGQHRKRTAETILNKQSSRSHSIFTIKIVQILTGENDSSVDTDKMTLGISQLSLVDLAGSERTKRTQNVGLRLKEAGNINNSLMTLRTCLELLRENQTTSTQKIIPYRESKLTHLFKNYFKGEGQLSMILCVNTHHDDYEENLHVLKFAEMSQEVQVTCPAPFTITLETSRPRKGRNVRRQEDESETPRVTTEIPKRNIAASKALDLSDMPSLNFTNGTAETYENLRRCFTTKKEQYLELAGEIRERLAALTESLHDFLREQYPRTDLNAYRAELLRDRNRMEEEGLRALRNLIPADYKPASSSETHSEN